METNGTRPIRVFSGNSNPQLAQDICEYLGIPLGRSQSFQFSEGSTYVKIEENVRGCDVFIIQSGAHPVNDHLVELLFLIDACRRASAASVTAVIPQYPYTKGDKKDEPRVSIRARVVAELIETVGADRVLTIDLQPPQIQGFFRIPVDNLYALPVFCDYIKEQGLTNVVVASPDMGSVKLARNFARQLDSDVVIGDKERIDHSEQVVIMDIVGNVEGKNVLIVDDMIMSGGTICAMAKELERRGALRIFACVTHGLLSPATVQNVAESPIESLMLTDTLSLRPDCQHPKIVQRSVAKLFGEAIKSIHEGTSISRLFV
ncbi:MAG: ribose-phosphate pyrophosphokinase [Candidatus Latescibacteria bacterium]|nr:ribose-phosphate pyrophosphokinase [Candidatus Latescibacterota bacterium]